MSSTDLGDAIERNPAFLLEHFKTHLVQRLVKIGIDAVRPAIEAEARQAVQDLDAQIRAHHDVYKSEVIVQLLIKPETK